MIDSHCHLDDPAFADSPIAVIERAMTAGVELMLTIDPAADFLDRFPMLLGSAGVHPHEAASANDRTIPELRDRARHPTIVAIGEIGLDYHYDFAPRDVQRRVFAAQLELAAELGLPVIIHTREAWDDTFAVLADHWLGPVPASGLKSPTGIMHCFSGGPSEARRSEEMGFYLAFGGVITFPKADEIREAARTASLDRLLLETDAPYLAPVPFRGKRNEPSYLPRTAERLAEVRGVPVAEIDRVTTANFRRLFSLD
jgi:TatD DNase family protein